MTVLRCARAIISKAIRSLIKNSRENAGLCFCVEDLSISAIFTVRLCRKLASPGMQR